MSKYIETSELNERITIIGKTEGHQGEFGWVEGGEEVILECWASIRQQYMKERVATIGTILEDTITFIIRYKQKATIKNEYILRHAGIDYEIIQQQPDISRKEFSSITAKKVGV